MATRRRLAIVMYLTLVIAHPAAGATLSGTVTPAEHAPDRLVPWRVQRLGDLRLPAPAGVTAPEGNTNGVVGEWTEVPRLWPPSTAGAGAAYDAKRDELVYFGGCCYQGDTWLFGDDAWRSAQPPVAPSARAGIAMAYDPVRGETVMFGGSEYAETWTWDGQTWSLHRPVVSPPRRADAAMAWMPRIGKIVLFGGYPDMSPGRIGSQLGDTWTWDGSTWEQIVSPVSPTPRYGSGLAVDPVSGDLVLFGGMDDAYASLDDTWVFDGSSWREVETDIAPPPRSYVQLVTNPQLGAVELFGGYHREGGLAILGDRWWFAGGRWTQELPGVEIVGSLPPGRLGGSLVHDSTAGELVMWGGSCDPTCGGVWRQRVTAATDDEGQPVARLEWQETASTWPLERQGAGALVDDPLGRGTLMHGGFGDSYGRGNPDDTWLWDGRWRRLETQGAPPGRQGGMLAAHPPSRTVVLFGGCIPYCAHIDDATWVFDGDRWTKAEVGAAPPARHRGGMAQDRNGGVVLFGGYGAGSQALGDTWVWDGHTWTERTPGTSPTARVLPQMAYDPKRREVVLFSGLDTTGATAPETWIWDGASWSQRTPAASPPGRLGAVMAWDPVAEEIVLYGGAVCAGGMVACVISSDVWTWDGETWTPRATPNGGPGARWFATGGSSADGIIVFGGHPGGTGLPLSDTWLWKAEDLQAPGG